MGQLDADALEREGWSLCRTFQKDKDTMVYEVKKPSDFPTIEERKTGKWEMLQIPISPPVYKCSVCGSHALPSAQPEIIRCKDCKYQEKYFHEDRRRKDGGYYIYGCELAEGYSHVCLDDDFCSRAERREE